MPWIRNTGLSFHYVNRFASRDEGVTSIVYTDEGGQEQSLVGKIVYTTDESGTGNIIIQVVAVF
jgi:hypothetical protein